MIKYVGQWELQNSGQTMILKNVKFSPIPESVLSNINKNEIPSELTYSFISTKARNNSVAVLEFVPLINDNGILKKVVSFEVEKNPGILNQTESFAPGLTNSVLATGDWFKFYVEKTGVHKISKSFLASLGIDVDNIDPRKIKIYGHGGEMLPLTNEDNHYYDPPQNPIKVIGEQDGSFDDSDYILFYATNTLGYNEESRTHVNAYADRSYYYITADGDNGQRIATSPQPTGNATLTINSFDDYQFYEVDEYSLVKMGRRWFGDNFNIQNSRAYNFKFP
ncbi:MAG TPA: peptidase C25, partial [Salinimicrobium sp.]|nr:peptidase C25 [Salinimicrobium sp.]